MNMKNIMIMIMISVGILVVGSTNAYAANVWTTQTSGTTNYLRSVDFIDADNGIAVGSNGIILKTTNGGVTWTTQTSGTSRDLLSVDFIDADNAIAVGSNGIILKTTNGGVTWTTQTSGTSQWLESVDFIDADNGIAVGDAATIRHTTNGGVTWTTQTSGTLNVLYAVDFIDADNAIAVDGGGGIIQTTNGGVTWTTTRSAGGVDQGLWDVDFIDADNGIAVGMGPRILKTTNGGVTWTTQTFGTTQVLFSVDFIDADNAIAVGSASTILKTTNGGVTWTTQTSGASGTIESVDFIDADNGIAVGQVGTILQSSTAPVISVFSPPDDPNSTVEGNNLNLKINVSGNVQNKINGINLINVKFTDPFGFVVYQHDLQVDSLGNFNAEFDNPLFVANMRDSGLYHAKFTYAAVVLEYDWNYLTSVYVPPVTGLPSQAIGQTTILGTCGLSFPNGNSVNYGAIIPNSISNEVILNMTNSGSASALLQIKGSDWKDGLNNSIMFVNKTHFNQTAFQNTYSSKALLNSTDGTVTNSFVPSALVKLVLQLQATLLNPTFTGSATQIMDFTVSC